MKAKMILGVYFVVWLLLVVLFGKLVLTIVFLGFLIGCSDSDYLGCYYVSEEEIRWTCFSAVLIGNIIYVLIASLFPESSWWHNDFTFWSGVGYVTGLTILNVPFNFWFFSGD